MFQYSHILTQLQQQVKKIKTDDSLSFLSVYLPFNQDSQSTSHENHIATQFKSLVTGAIQKSIPLSEQKQLRLTIIDIISAFSGSFDMTKKGVCVYATLRARSHHQRGNNNNSSEELVAFMLVVPLFILPSQNSSAFVGEVFDLIPLLDNLNFDNPALIIDFHQDEALLYEFGQMHLELLTKVQNSYHKFPESEEYLDQSQGNHSNRKDFNYEEDYLHQFLRDDVAKSLHKYTDQYKNLVVVCPEEYQLQISKFGESLNNQFSEIQNLYLTTNKTPEMLYHHLSAMLQKQIKEAREITIQELTNPINKLQTDVQAILEASQKGQIEILYVFPDYHTPGFVSDKSLAQITDPLNTVTESRRHDMQTRLHIIQNVIEFGGKVMTISTNSLDEKSHTHTLFASLRY